MPRRARSLLTPFTARSPFHRRRASLRCEAASKGIEGDGRVKMCNSKEAFEAACAEAGDSLVRTARIPPRAT